MITLIIKDGLGNQLFQYAYARYLQESFYKNDKLYINPFYINHKDFRRLSLQHFNLGEKTSIIKNEADQAASMKAFKIRVLWANLFELIPWKIFKQKPLGKNKFIKRAHKGLYYTYTSQTNFGIYHSNTKNKFVFGCFQGVENFKPIEHIIKKEFQIVTKASKENQAILNNIEKTNSICLHIRRGDYLDPKWKSLQICNFHYYQAAIDKICQSVSSPTFYIFSNNHEDIEWIKNNYHFKINETASFNYIDLNNPDYEELRLMIACKHFIISNSTFSWWAAYLANNPNKIVIAPDKWNLNYSGSEMIYLKEWIKIPTIKYKNE